MPGLGDVVGKVFDWLPGRKEAKENSIAKLLRENAELQKQHPLSSTNAGRIADNADRIKRLREEISRIK